MEGRVVLVGEEVGRWGRTAHHSVGLEHADGGYGNAGFRDPIAGAQTAENNRHASAHCSKK